MLPKTSSYIYRKTGPGNISQVAYNGLYDLQISFHGSNFISTTTTSIYACQPPRSCASESLCCAADRVHGRVAWMVYVVYVSVDGGDDDECADGVDSRCKTEGGVGDRGVAIRSSESSGPQYNRKVNTAKRARTGSRVRDANSSV